MSEYSIHPIGTVHRGEAGSRIEIFTQYEGAMFGLAGFSHIYVLYWFHQNDTPQKRAVLQVHPRKNPANPLTGVFGTHSPLRPNPIGLTLCRIQAIERNVIYVDAIDALDGSPVIDIKCFIPDREPLTGVRLPSWV